MKALLEKVNKSTKWVVSSAVFGVLFWKRDPTSCWCVLGSIAAAFNCKLLKLIISQARPDGARKVDPGMPSSHAQSLGFLSTYAALELCSSGASINIIAATATVGAGGFLSWLRVALGFHTTAQVLVGHMLGACTAAGWKWLYGSLLLPALSDDSSGRVKMCLHTATGAAMFLFIGKAVKSWRKEIDD
eukprot:TRINITY_DN11734_c0_g1_i1.p1 TRINITY_DN11734_c0_g1~~TRINITY_DN11734_c0_g1_i1.p1  ORF type:complete len:188 (+),score=19.87 TRINITY_DN11734_c0_g1_i1:112-675(+)